MFFTKIQSFHFAIRMLCITFAWMKRTFEHRVAWPSLVCIILLAVLALLLFWQRTGMMALLALLVVCLDVAVIERVVHTSYTIEGDMLSIYRGRFSRVLHIPVVEILQMQRRPVLLGLSSYVLVEYGSHHYVSVQPSNEEAFISEIKKLQKRLDDELEK